MSLLRLFTGAMANIYTTVNSPYANLEILYQLVYRKLYHSLTGSYSTHRRYTNHALRGSYSSHRHYTNLLTGSCSTHSQEAMPLMGPVLLTYKKLYHLRISLRNCSLLETATQKKGKLHSVPFENISSQLSE